METLKETGELMVLEAQSRRLSKATIQFYKHRLASILSLMGDKPIAKVGHLDCRMVLAKSPGKTAEHNYRVMATLFTFALKEELIKKNPMEKVEKPKVVARLVEPLSIADINALFKALTVYRNLGRRWMENFGLLTV